MPKQPYPFRRYERTPFDTAACDGCGKCLEECPVLKLPEEQAKTAIRSLAGQGTEGAKLPDRVLSACTSCFACNLICPLDCRPANLILDTWHTLYQREGLPERARYFLPNSPLNFRTHVIRRLSPEEKAAVESWKSLEPAEAIFYPGCNLITSPYLTFSKLFDGMTIRGALDYCCGEMYFRMGLYDQVEQTARRCTEYFRRLGVKRVYMLCTAGLNLFTHVLPQFGADFSGIAFVPYLKVLYERLTSGVLPVVKRFSAKTVTIQDSCHTKIYEKGFEDWPRKILEYLGFEVREAAQHKQAALCCGIGSGFSHDAAFKKSSMIAGQRKCAQNLRRAATDFICVYCSGCMQMLFVARYMARIGRPIYHLTELIQEAIGETPQRRQKATAIDFLVGTLRNQKGGGKRFFVPPMK